MSVSPLLIVLKRAAEVKGVQLGWEISGWEPGK
jgi:hypothetical protein